MRPQRPAIPLLDETGQAFHASTPTMELQKSMTATINPLPSNAMDDSFTKTEVSPPTRRQHSIWHKMGAYAIFVLIIGTITILLGLGFITFFWKGVGATSEHAGSRWATFWRTVMVKAWMSQAITLLSLVIRLSSSAQAGICTSMLAALLLESCGVPLPWVAEISLIRSITTGPHHLATAVLSALPKFRAPLLVSTLLTMVLTTLLLQFCSTALFSDIWPGMIVMETKDLDISYGKRYNPAALQVYQGISYWLTKPASYPAFAEYSESFLQDEDSFYTGKVSRAMLPFSDSSMRSLVHKYSGLATVASLSTVCVRPSIEATILSSSFSAPRLAGRVSGSPSTQIIKENPMFISINEDFNCTLPIYSDEERSNPQSLKEWPIAMCRLLGNNDATYGGPFLMLNITRGDRISWLSIRTDKPHNVTIDRTDGVWQHMTSTTANIDFTASICWTDGSVGTQQVDISSLSPRSEPALGWSLKTQDYNTTAIRAQLGAGSGAGMFQPTKQERGVLDLNPKFSENRNATSAIITFEHLAVRREYSPGMTAAMCAYCKINDDRIDSDDFWAHRTQIAVFQDILVSTLNPALALQAQYFTLLQMAHYDMQLEMDVTSPASISFYEEVLMPRQWNGYIAVAIVLVVHLVCVVLTVTLFVTRTRLTLLGNTWSAVAQIIDASSTSKRTATTSAMQTDEEVRKQLKHDCAIFRLGGPKEDENQPLMVRVAQ